MLRIAHERHYSMIKANRGLIEFEKIAGLHVTHVRVLQVLCCARTDDSPALSRCAAWCDVYVVSLTIAGPYPPPPLAFSRSWGKHGGNFA